MSFREQTLPHHLSTQMDYARRNLTLAIFALAGGDEGEVDRLANTQHIRIREGLKELCQRKIRPGPIAARHREIAVKPFPVKKTGTDDN
jgi:hypothetical protein